MIEFSKPVRQVQAKIQEMLTKLEGREVAEGRASYAFFRSDTGTGKTSGFVKAVAQSDKRYAIAVPTMNDVDQIYSLLYEAIGDEVGYWHSNSSESKSEAREKRVFVGTHKFLLNVNDQPSKYIGDRDVLIVDEVPSQGMTKSIRQSDILKAREYAESYLPAEYKQAFCALDGWANERHTAALERGGNASIDPVSPTQLDLLLDAEREIVRIPDEAAKTCIREVVEFVFAASENRAFERVQRTSSGYSLNFVWYFLPAHNLKRVAIFSATCHLDGPQFSPDAINTHRGFIVDYSNLTVQKVAYPDVPKAMRQFLGQHFDMAIDHIWAMLETAAKLPEHREILVVLPKRLKDTIAYKLGLPSELETFVTEKYFPVLFEDFKQPTKVHFTNWGRDVGSNEYRECRAVILWNNHHKPKHATLAELLHYSEELVSSDGLQPYQQGRFKGTKAGRLEEDQLYAAIKQMGARGNCRNIDDNGLCGEMQIYIAWDQLDKKKLLEVYPGATCIETATSNPVLRPKPKGVTKKALAVLEKIGDRDEVLASEVTRHSRYYGAFRKERHVFQSYGWDFVSGGRGRNGKQSKFVSLS